MDFSAIALRGLQQADFLLNQAATGIASFGATSPDGASLDTVSFSAEMVALMSAQNLSSVNLRTLQTAGEIQKSMIDTMA